MDDNDDWEVIGPIQPRRLDSVISVRLSADEAAELRDAANRAGMTLSAFLRAKGLTAARGQTLNMHVGYPSVTTGGVAEVTWLTRSA
jgi:hypothetical protein